MKQINEELGKERYQKAFKLGQWAFKNGKLFSKNPYKDDLKELKSGWSDGWKHAKENKKSISAGVKKGSDIVESNLMAPRYSKEGIMGKNNVGNTNQRTVKLKVKDRLGKKVFYPDTLDDRSFLLQKFPNVFRNKSWFDEKEYDQMLLQLGNTSENNQFVDFETLIESLDSGTLSSKKDRAIASAKARGHNLGNWNDDNGGSTSKCSKCGAEALVTMKDNANGRDVQGKAVDNGCSLKESFDSVFDYVPKKNSKSNDDKNLNVFNDLPKNLDPESEDENLNVFNNVPKHFQVKESFGSDDINLNSEEQGERWSKAYTQGEAAHKSGVSYYDNPYGDSTLGEEWADGWEFSQMGRTPRFGEDRARDQMKDYAKSTMKDYAKSTMKDYAKSTMKLEGISVDNNGNLIDTDKTSPDEYELAANGNFGDEGENICKNCGAEILETGDEMRPWVHAETNKITCGVDHYSEKFAQPLIGESKAITLKEGGVVLVSESDLNDLLKRSGVNLLESHLNPIHTNKTDIDSYELRFSYTSNKDNQRTLVESLRKMPGVKRVVIENNLGVISFVDGVEIDVR